MLGLLLSYVLFILIRLDYDLILIIIPVIVFMAFYSLGKYYVSPTIFTVTLTALGLDYYTSDVYAVDIFFFDYVKSTITALGICVFFEFFIFKKNNLTHKFYLDLQQALVNQLKSLLNLVTTQPIRRSYYLKLSVQFNVKALELHAFLNAVKHDYHFENHQFNQLEEFNETIELAYQNIRQLFVSGPERLENLVLETKNTLERLTVISQGLEAVNILSTTNAAATGA